MKVKRREDKSRPDKTTLSKFTCVGNENILGMNGNMQPQHTTKLTKVKMQHEPNKQNTMCVLIYLLMYAGARMNHHGR